MKKELPNDYEVDLVEEIDLSSLEISEALTDMGNSWMTWN